MPNAVSTNLNFANLQMAAEAIFPVGFTSGAIPIATLTTGNNRSSKFTAAQAAQFAAEWEVVDHRANSGTGFSGTLFRYKGSSDPSRGLVNGQLVMSLRSTEFADDSARDTQATNMLEIQQFGWAFGQIADMKKWFDALDADPAKLQGQRFSVTGYSLGGHLATALNQLMSESGQANRIGATYTFNGAGVGNVLSGTLTETISQFESLRDANHESHFQTSAARSLYLTWRATLNNPSASMTDRNAALVAVTSELAPMGQQLPPDSPARRELQLLLDAIVRTKSVLADAQAVIGGVSSGSPDSPAARAVGLEQMEQLEVDYQLAVLRTAARTSTFRTSLTDVFGNAYSADRAERPLPPGSPPIYDVYAAPPPSAVANSQIHYGQRVPVYIEDQPLARGNLLATIGGNALRFGEFKLLGDGFAVNDFGDTHSLALLVDSLAVQDAIARLDPAIQQSVLDAILSGGSNAKMAWGYLTQGTAEHDTLERTVQSLADLIGVSKQPGWKPMNPNPSGGTWAEVRDNAGLNAGGFTGRDTLHANLTKLNQSTEFQTLMGHVSIAPSATADLKELAPTDFSAIATLITMSPVLVQATDLAGVAALNTLCQGEVWAQRYDEWLDDEVARVAGRDAENYTPDWLADRALLLDAVVAKSLKNESDTVLVSRPGTPPNTALRDITSGRTILSGAVNPDQRAQIVFGRADEDTIDGFGKEDRLYGGAGNDRLNGFGGADRLEGQLGNDTLDGGAGIDTLLGQAGDDFLEGGADNDLLLGGAGNDTYFFTSGWGKDTIEDVDGQGTLRVPGYDGGLPQGKKQSDGVYLSADGQVSYRFDSSGQTLTIAFEGRTDSILVRRWQSGQLGLTFDEQIVPFEVDRTVVGTAFNDQLTWSDPSDDGIVMSAALYGLDGADRIDSGLSDVGTGVLDHVAGASAIVAENHRDYVEGGAGNDTIFTMDGFDTIFGGDGDDEIRAGHFLGHPGVWSPFLRVDITEAEVRAYVDEAYWPLRREIDSNLVDGGPGNDLVVAGWGDDVVHGGEGADILIGQVGSDVLFGDLGDDSVYGDAGSIYTVDMGVVYNDQGDPQLWSTVNPQYSPADLHGGDYLDGGAGIDWLWGMGGDDTMFGGMEGDYLFGDDEYDENINDEELTPLAYHGSDFLDGGEGADMLVGGAKDDALYGGDGADRIWGDSDRPRLRLDLHGDDAIDGGGGNDSIMGGGGDDDIFAGDGDDSIHGDDLVAVVGASAHGSDYIDAGAGNDTVFGFGGDDIVAGGSGNDDISGDGTGDDGLTGSDWLEGGDGDDTLRGQAGADWLLGDAGIDRLDAGDGDDTLDGGAGTDDMYGGAGNDTYLIDAGSSPTTGANLAEAITDTQGMNVIEFGQGVDLQAMTAATNGLGDLILFFGSNDVLFVAGGLGGAIGAYRFADGQSLSLSELIGRTSQTPMTVQTPAGTQQVFGGRGNDLINSSGGFGQVSGGYGDDTLTGSGGGNAYFYGRGDGRDAVTDIGGLDPNTGAQLPTSRIVFGAGIVPSDVTLTSEGALVLNVGADGLDQIRILGFNPADALTPPNIDAYVFADGTTLTHAQLLDRGFDFVGSDAVEDVVGTSVADRFAASAGADTMRGGAGSDTYELSLGAGADSVIDGDGSSSGAIDTLRVAPGLAPADVVLYRVGQDLLVRDRGASASVTVIDHFAGSGVESMAFDDGTVWDSAAIAAHVINELTEGADNCTGSSADDIIDARGGNDTVRGGAGNDLVDGSSGSDLLMGELGNDTLNGGAGTDVLFGGDGGDTLIDGESMYGEEGNDTYVLTTWQAAAIADYGAPATSIDTLALPVAAVDVRVLRGFNSSTQGFDDLVLRANGQTGDVVVDRFFFADAANGANKIESIRFPDDTTWSVVDVFAQVVAVQTTEGNDAGVVGFRWADNIDGKGGNDSIDGRQGDDTLSGGSGKDTLYGGEGNDVASGGADADSIFGDSSEFVETGNGNDTLEGGAGADTLYGAGGDDAYRFGRASDVDRVEEVSGSDRIVLDAGITPADVSLLRNGPDLVLAVDASATQLSVAGHFAAATSQIEAVEFADGTTWSASEIATRTIAGTPNAMTGTAGNDTFVVDNRGDTITEAAGQGFDTVQASVSYTLSANLEHLALTGYLNAFGNGNAENNQVTGNLGHNTLAGASGQDTLVGGAGNDTLHGNDVGQWSDGAADSLAGGAGDDVYYLHSGDADAVVELADEGADTVNLSFTGVQYVLPANVESLTVVVDLAGNGATLTGNAQNNTIAVHKNVGGRTLDGGAGADTLIGPGFDLDATYVVDNQGDVIVSGGSGAPINGRIGGVDTVISTIDWTLAFNLETLRLQGSATYGTGNALNNVLDGSGTAAANVLTGGLGDDTYRVGAGDVVVEQAGQGTDSVFVAAGAVGNYSIAPFANVENLTLADALGASGAEGNDADNVIFGNTSGNVLSGVGGNDQIADAVGTTDVGHDTLLGGAGNDTLTSFYGQDVMDGGAGDDVIRFARQQATGTVVFGKGVGHDVAEGGWATAVKRVQFKADTQPGDVLFTRSGPDLVATVAGTGDTLTLKYFFVDDLSWTPTGEFGTFEFISEGVQLSAAAIASRAQSGNVNQATSGDDLLLGGGGSDTLAGAAGSDNLLSGDGDDDLTGGLGSDTLYGGLGSDTYRFANGDGFDTIRDAGGSNDRMRFTDMPSTAISVRQFGGDLWFLQQSTGSGLMQVREFFTNAAFEIEAAEFSDSVVWDSATLKTMASQIIGTSGADSLTGTSAADRIYGLAGNDTLLGLDGDDLLDGGTGNDSMVGDLGNDTFVVDSASDTTAETTGQGTDTVQSSITYTLPSTQSVENLTLTGSANINATGNNLANVLTGNAGNNTLTGGTGADTMIGGAGNDTFVIDNAGDVVIELAGEGTDLVQSSISITALAANVENLALTGTSGLSGTGNALNNVLTGNSGANTLNGGAGNDRIDGGSGTDTMVGGLGDDTYVVNVSTDVVTELAGEGTDTIESTVTLTLGGGNTVENLRLLGTSALSATGNGLANVLTGNSGNNTLTGNAGDDTLDGGAGTDTMRGGTGNDTYVVERSADVTTENANEGTDTVLSSVTRTLGSNLENLTLTGTSAINGTGNTDANVLIGNSAANTLAGLAGHDTYDGGAGTDTLTDNATTGSNDTYRWGVGYGVDTVSDAGGTDTVQFGAGISAAQLAFAHVGSNLEVTIVGNSGDKLVISNYYVGTANKIETFQLNDGTTVAPAQIPLSAVNRQFAATDAAAESGQERQQIMPVRMAAEAAPAEAPLRAAHPLPWKLWTLRDDMLLDLEVPAPATAGVTDAIMLNQAQSLVSAMAAFGVQSAAIGAERQMALPMQRVEPMWVSPVVT